MIVYADTSALVKLVLDEDGSTLVRATFDSAVSVVAAVIAYAELRAAVGTALRDGRIPPTRRDSTLALLERLWGKVAQIVVDGPLARQAGELADRFRLRGYDAVHLAALTQSGQPTEVTFACWDLQLARAASDLGYEVVPSH